MLLSVAGGAAPAPVGAAPSELRGCLPWGFGAFLGAGYGGRGSRRPFPPAASFASALLVAGANAASLGVGQRRSGTPEPVVELRAPSAGFGKGVWPSLLGQTAPGSEAAALTSRSSSPLNLVASRGSRKTLVSFVFLSGAL